MSAMSFSTANWHWKNKTVTPWAKKWFEDELTTVSVDDEAGETPGARVQVTQLVEYEGDVELGRRKSKYVLVTKITIIIIMLLRWRCLLKDVNWFVSRLITIFDCRIVLEWTGTASDGAEAKGRLVIPEVSHDIMLDGTSDYTWEFTLTSSLDSATDALFGLAKKKLPGALEARLALFPAALIDAHGKDIIVGDDPSRSGTPTPGGTTAAATTTPSAVSAAPSAAAAAPKKKQTTVNTAEVVVEATFQASAGDLYSILTDEKRIPSWSRASAKVCEAPSFFFTICNTFGEFNFVSRIRGKVLSMCFSAVGCGGSMYRWMHRGRSSRRGFCRIRPGRRVSGPL
jgi:activator of HSP90 ATPase